MNETVRHRMNKASLEAVFTITLGCSAMERHLGSMPMSGGSDMEDGLGQQDLARDRDSD